MTFGELGMISKSLIYLGLSGGLTLGFFWMSPIIIALFSLSLCIVTAMHLQNNSLTPRLDGLLQDLDRSEKALQGGGSFNAELEKQLKTALEENVAVHLKLEKSRAELEALANEAKIKEKEIDEVRQQSKDLCQELTTVTDELRELKRGYGANMVKFFANLKEVSEIISKEKLERTPTPRPGLES